MSPEIAPPGVTLSSTLTLEAIVNRLAQGDPKALVTLFDLTAPRLIALAQRIVGDRAEAEDVVQESFERIWHEAPSFDRSRGTAITWLFTVTRNRAIDHLRMRQRRHRTESGHHPEGSIPRSPEGETIEARRAIAVRKALSALDPVVRSTLELSYFDGLSHAEIAEKTHQPLGTVKTRIAQGVRALREALAGLG